MAKKDKHSKHEKHAAAYGKKEKKGKKKELKDMAKKMGSKVGKKPKEDHEIGTKITVQLYNNKVVHKDVTAWSFEPDKALRVREGDKLTIYPESRITSFTVDGLQEHAPPSTADISSSFDSREPTQEEIDRENAEDDESDRSYAPEEEEQDEVDRMVDRTGGV